MESDAIFIRLRAERRLGEMLREGKDDRATAGGDRDIDANFDGSGTGPIETTLPTLESMGIAKRLANQARTLDRMSEAEFEEHAAQYVARATVRGGGGTGEYERYTPGKYIELARTVMGTIDLDPASCDVAQNIVRATRFFTAQDDGLTKEWYGNIWLNPPYHRDLGPRFVRKLLTELAFGRVTQAVMLTNNSTDTDWFREAVSVCQAVCFTKGRINFLESDGVTELFPTQGQTLFYYGTEVERFCDEFSKVRFLATQFRSYLG
jgi:ParB family chromosome partitioning protein